MNHYKKILTVISLIIIFMNSFVCIRVDAACGNKIIEADEGEACEPPNVGACNGDCEIGPWGCLNPDDIQCGNNLVEAGEKCEPPDPEHGCSKECLIIQQVCDDPNPNDVQCGNNLVEAGEECEPPNPEHGCSKECLIIQQVCDVNGEI